MHHRKCEQKILTIQLLLYAVVFICSQAHEPVLEPLFSTGKRGELSYTSPMASKMSFNLREIEQGEFGSYYRNLWHLPQLFLFKSNPQSQIAWMPNYLFYTKKTIYRTTDLCPLRVCCHMWQRPAPTVPRLTCRIVWACAVPTRCTCACKLMSRAISPTSAQHVAVHDRFGILKFFYGAKAHARSPSTARRSVWRFESVDRTNGHAPLPKPGIRANLNPCASRRCWVPALHCHPDSSCRTTPSRLKRSPGRTELSCT